MPSADDQDPGNDQAVAFARMRIDEALVHVVNQIGRRGKQIIVRGGDDLREDPAQQDRADQRRQALARARQRE